MFCKYFLLFFRKTKQHMHGVVNQAIEGLIIERFGREA